MALGPPQSKEDWLYATVHNIATQLEVLMAELSDLRASAQATRARVEELVQRESAQSAALAGLGGAVDQLITLVVELRNGLSPEEQAVASEALAEIAATLSATDTALAGTTAQTTAISDLAARATAAAGGGSEEPPPPSP